MQSTLNEQAKEIIRTRLRRWCEPILDDTRWRSHLVDEQANQLLAWGMAQVEQTAVHTQHLPDEEADPMLKKRQYGSSPHHGWRQRPHWHDWPTPCI